MKKKFNHNRLLLWLCVFSLAVMIVALAFSGGNEPQVVFTPPPFEKMAQTGVPDVPSDCGWTQVDAKVYKASVCGEISVSNGEAELWFTNPAENTVWLKLRVLDGKGNILGETGVLRPNEYVRMVVLSRSLRAGEPIKLKIMGYEPETYYSAGSVVLNTQAS